MGNKHMDELLKQRLVDGRLSVDQIRNVIRSAEETPEHWREIATAFLEEQLWQRSLVREGKPEAAREHGLEPAPAAWSVPTAQVWNWVVAASLLLALPLMYWGGRQSVRPGASSVSTSTTTGLVAADSSDMNPQAVRPADYRTPFSVGIRNGEGYETVPVMPESVARELGYQPNSTKIPGQLQAQLRRSGFQLNSKIHYLRGNTGDGREVIVPIEAVQIAPFGQ